MQKGLFIGLGGSGITTVARLKALLFQRAYGSDKSAMDNDCSFIFYDTDYKYFDMLNRIYEKHREQIEQEAFGCCIHKELVHRDIGQAFNRVRSK